MKKQLLVSLVTVILLQSVSTHTAESSSDRSWSLKGWLAAGACALGLGTYCYYKMGPQKTKINSVDNKIGQIPAASVEPIEVIALEAQRELLPVELSPEQMRDIRAAKLQEAIDNKKNVSTAAVNPVVNAPVSKPVVAKKPRSEQPDRSKFLNRFPGF